MFKTIRNLMKLKIKITPQTPLLVSSGKTFDVTRPDMEFFRLNTPWGETIYIPGSSIKGVLRAGLEAVLGENKKFSEYKCCTSEKMCHKIKTKNMRTNKVPYQEHCPVCRIFGSGDLASRLEISDVFPYGMDDKPEAKEKKILETGKMMSSRTGIQIDRKTGKTKGGALFEYEIFSGGELFGEFSFTNYELHQPGLLFTLFALAGEGFLRFGHSKSRGLGVLKFDPVSIKILQMGPLKGDRIKGHSGNHIIGKSFDIQTNPLYSTFYFDKPEEISYILNQLKTKVDEFLEEG